MTTKRRLAIAIAVQLAMLMLVGLAAAGVDIPVLRPLTGFVYLSIVPGWLILVILGRHRRDWLENLLYSVGLSLVVVMLVGFAVNLTYPFIGIARPISLLPLTVTFTVVFAVLSVGAYLRARRDSSVPLRMTEEESPSPDLSRQGRGNAERPRTTARGSVPLRTRQGTGTGVFSPAAMFLVLLPLLSVVGAYYLANFHRSNTLLLVLLGLIAAVPVLVAFGKFIHRGLYPLAVLMISVSLLLHQTLISPHIWGNDIWHEYYLQNQVLANSVWDSSVAGNVNAMLSIVIVAPVYSLLMATDPIWIFKTVYPLLFALFPLTMFQVYRRQTDDRTAFLAAFFLMSLAFFFAGMVQNGRMETAFIFFGLFLLTLLEGITVVQRALLVLWGLAISVSHYGTSYFFMFYNILALFLLLAMANGSLAGAWRRFTARVNRSGMATTGAGQGIEGPEERSFRPLSSDLVILLTVFSLSWYMYVSSGSAFESIVNIGNHVYNSLGEFLVPESRQPEVLLAIGALPSEAVLAMSLQRQILLRLQYAVELFIVIGVVGLVFNFVRARFQPVYVAMTLVSAVALLLAIVLPRFTPRYGMERFLYTTLIFLAPFCILGGTTVLRWLSRLLPSRVSRRWGANAYLKLLVVLVLAPYFLYNTAFIYAVTGDRVTSVALNPDLDAPVYREQDIAARDWLLSNRQAGTKIFADYSGSQWFAPELGRIGGGVFGSDTDAIPAESYIYLRGMNVKLGLVRSPAGGGFNPVELHSSEFGQRVLAQRSKVYANGGAEVYR